MHEFGLSLTELKNETLAFQRGISVETSLLDIENGKPSETRWKCNHDASEAVFGIMRFPQFF